MRKSRAALLLAGFLLAGLTLPLRAEDDGRRFRRARVMVVRALPETDLPQRAMVPAEDRVVHRAEADISSAAPIKATGLLPAVSDAPVPEFASGPDAKPEPSAALPPVPLMLPKKDEAKVVERRMGEEEREAVRRPSLFTRIRRRLNTPVRNSASDRRLQISLVGETKADAPVPVRAKPLPPAHRLQGIHPVMASSSSPGEEDDSQTSLAAVASEAPAANLPPSAPQEGASAAAEESVSASAAVPAASYVAPQYRIRTGDTLQISIPYETDSQRSVPVRPDGRINYLFDVEVMAAGKTYNELNAALCGKLARYYKNPQVTIIGKSFAGNAVYVMGPVGRPGRHEIQNDSRLLDILSMAGAMSLIPQTDQQGSSRTKEVVDLERAIVIRGDQQLDVNFNDLLQGKNIAVNNIRLMPRDFIYLPSSYSTNKRIYIIGAVDTPKVHYFSGDMTFMGAIAEAEGVINGAAWVRRCYVIRGGVKKPKEVIRVDYASLLKGRGEDLLLESGDVVYVPKNPLFQINEVLTSVVQPLRTVIELDDIAKNQFREGHRMYKNISKSRFWK